MATTHAPTATQLLGREPLTRDQVNHMAAKEAHSLTTWAKRYEAQGEHTKAARYSAEAARWAAKVTN